MCKSLGLPGCQNKALAWETARHWSGVFPPWHARRYALVADICLAYHTDDSQWNVIRCHIIGFTWFHYILRVSLSVVSSSIAVTQYFSKHTSILPQVLTRANQTSEELGTLPTNTSKTEEALHCKSWIFIWNTPFWEWPSASALPCLTSLENVRQRARGQALEHQFWTVRRDVWLSWSIVCLFKSNQEQLFSWRVSHYVNLTWARTLQLFHACLLVTWNGNILYGHLAFPEAVLQGLLAESH